MFLDPFLPPLHNLCKIISTTHNYKHGSVVFPSFPQPTRVTPQQLEEKKEKKGFVTIVIANALKVISMLRRNYFT